MLRRANRAIMLRLFTKVTPSAPGSRIQVKHTSAPISLALHWDHSLPWAWPNHRMSGALMMALGALMMALLMYDLKIPLLTSGCPKKTTPIEL